MRLLAYGASVDSLDENLCMAESTALKTLRLFCRAIIELFSHEYLSQPSKEQMLALMTENEARGLPGMLGSLDCCHWVWHGCPVAWQGVVLLQSRIDFEPIEIT